MFEESNYEAGDMTADEAIESVLKRPELYGLCRVEERDSTLARIARVEALHEKHENTIHPWPEFVCSHRHCVDDAQDQNAWPCPTVRALREGEPDAQV